MSLSKKLTGQDCKISAFVTGVLLLWGTALFAFYLLLYHRNNAAPTILIGKLTPEYFDQFHYRVERCTFNPKKIALKGWIVRKGHGAEERVVNVVYMAEDQRLHKIKTSIEQREDLIPFLRDKLGDRITYHSAGFAASLRIGPGTAYLAPAPLYLLYEDRSARVLLSVACAR